MKTAGGSSVVVASTSSSYDATVDYWYNTTLTTPIIGDRIEITRENNDGTDTDNKFISLCGFEAFSSEPQRVKECETGTQNYEAVVMCEEGKYVDSIQISSSSTTSDQELTGIKSISFRCSNPENPSATRSSFKTVGTESDVKSDSFTTPDSYICGMKADHGAIKLENQGLLRIGMALCPNCQMTSCGLNQKLVETDGCSQC